MAQWGQSQTMTVYPQGQGAFNPWQSCQVGTINIDSSCVCPNLPNTAPFNVEPDLMMPLFEPFQQFPVPTDAAKMLVKERAPYHKAPLYNRAFVCDVKTF
jgi:hypothetical protein